MIALYLFLALVLLLLNGFFVLAEFAAVKMRPSRIAEMIERDVPGAVGVKRVQTHLDEYLSVCQLGITFCSIGLGFVAEPAVVKLIEPLIEWTGLFPNAASNARWFTAHGIAFAISYLLVSVLHILIGELVPKSISIRLTETSALWTAAPLRFFHIMFYGPLIVLNGTSNFILHLMGIPPQGVNSAHSEEELLILLSKGQSEGMMSFRRLLFVENIFDLGELKAKDAMRPRSQVQTLNADSSWEDAKAHFRRYRFTRYPLIERNHDMPIGIVHIKDAILTDASEVDWRQVQRRFISTSENTSLESLLAEMQRRRIHVAIVLNDKGVWTGFLTLEDIIEEIIGTIRDEFEDEEQFSLSETLSAERCVLDVEAETTIDAVRAALAKIPDAALPISREAIIKVIDERERSVETYLGNGIGMPHARVDGIRRPFVIFIHTQPGVSYRNTREKADLLFVLLTPTGLPRVHQRLQATIATVMDESELIPQRLRSASTTEEVIEILRTGEQATLD